MLADNDTLARILDRELIGFLTAVDGSGQPQTSPVWFMRDDDDIVVYNKPDTPRFASIAHNPKVAFTLRGDRRGTGMVSLEGVASRDEGLPPAIDFPGYVEKYLREIESLGWTPEVFAGEYRAGLRIVVTRVRAFGLDQLDR
jgi:PPOX class probable F420-dependent enzyme